MAEDKEKKQKKTPRGGGAADLAAWSRTEAGAAGEFTNPDTSDWIPFRPGPEDVTDESVFDASHFVHAPSGKHGFLRGNAQGKFEFEDGTPARFLGGQANVFPDKDYAEWHVKWMRRHGLNLVRGHGFGLPDEEKWDKLDYFINECKKAGVYLILTPIYWTQMIVVDPTGEEIETTSHVILFFDENLEQAARDIWQTFYHHRNPYTGLRYYEDPTIMGFELKNEDSTVWALEWVKRDAPQYWEKMLRQYADFLLDKYGSTEALGTAWTDEGRPESALEEDETIEDGNIELLDMHPWWDYESPEQKYPRQRKSDQMEFLHKKQRAFYERSYEFLREIGCRQAICGSNWRGHSYTMRLVLECDAMMDYTDQHDYWDHPQGGWTTEDAVFHNKSMLKSGRGGLVGNLAPRQVLGKPYIMTEWNIGSWNEHVPEASFAMIAYGCLQGWSGLLQFTLTPTNWAKGVSHLRNRFFNVADTPSVALQYPTLSRIWHRGDIQESEPVFIRRISPENIYTPGGIETRYFPYAWMVGPPEMEPKPGQYGYMVPAVGKVLNEFVDQPAPHLCRDKELQELLDEENKIARSVTGELTWDWGNGLCVIDSPMTQGVCGYVGGSGIETRDAVFDVQTRYCVVFITSLDDDSPIAESDHLMVTALGRARNTGTVLGRPEPTDDTERSGHAHRIGLPQDERVAVLELGEEPVLTEPVRGALSLSVSDPEGATVNTLDHAGRRTGEIRAAAADGRLVLPMPGENGVCHYEVCL
ncbi:MAG: hypothetical protein R6X33_04885 [Candidatus Brocadiia bacterium]